MGGGGGGGVCDDGDSDGVQYVISGCVMMTGGVLVMTQALSGDVTINSGGGGGNCP